MRTLRILIAAVLWLSVPVLAARAMTPGGIEKKFIALASDVTFSTPSDIAYCIRRFEECCGQGKARLHESGGGFCPVLPREQGETGS